MNQVIHAKRLGLLARKDLLQFWRSTAIAAGSVVGAVLIASVFGAIFGPRDQIDYEGFFYGTLAIWGCVAASLAFHELHDKTRNEDFLLLPASPLEKTVVRLIWTSIVLPAIIMVVIAIAAVLSETVIWLFFDMPFEPFRSFEGFSWEVVADAVVLQSVFFLGAAWFKKSHFIKTALSIIILGVALSIFAMIMFRVIFAPYFHDFFANPVKGINFGHLFRSRLPFLARNFETIGNIFFYGLLAPFCWITAWMRVRETQSSDGI